VSKWAIYHIILKKVVKKGKKKATKRVSEGYGDTR
jgi:ribosomal protein L9